MTSSTAIRKPANGVQEWMDEDFAQHPLEHLFPLDDAAGSSRAAEIVLGAAVVAMGLLAGLFYAFDVAVMPGLTAADDRTLVAAMQRMIDLPAFPLTLLAAPTLAAVALVQARRSGSTRTARLIVASLALYAVMAVVSVAVHFPLNDALMQAGDPDAIADLAAARNDFAAPWIAWNVVRTLALTAAFACLAWALACRGGMGRAKR